jgi:hypothetical protein
MAAQGTVTRQELRQETTRGKPARPKAFVFAFKPPTKSFNLRMSFSKARVDKTEIIEALEAILKELRQK